MSSSSKLGWLAADWPAPGSVQAGTTLRRPGPSLPPYDQFNLALHVQDHADTVLANRRSLKQSLGLPAEPRWLEQVHSTIVVEADRANGVPQADAAYSHRSGTACVVMTADCLPVLFTNQQGTSVAAAHAGWRGLAEGILEKTFDSAGFKPSQTLAWLGPAIGPEAYEVGEEVKQAFMRQVRHAESAFVKTSPGKYLMDMYTLARQKLNALGVEAVYGGEHCTFRQAEQFYSYRRDGLTGRMASLIWIASAT